MAKILIDEPIEDGKLGFDQYASSFVDIIMDTKPQFTIGIFGDWGTGKTTLMQTMRKKLQGEKYKENVVTVWFNAWLYEREKYLAIVPLLNTILVEISTRKELNTVKETISKVLLSIIKATKFGLEYGGAKVEIDPGKEIKNTEDTIYYDKFKHIKDAIDEVNKKKDFRIVVFVDDLDRCAPDKVLEVFESIKVFLGIKGFIYVLGVSREVIEKCINKKYEDLGIDGKDYIKKIIQIPFRIPEWQDPELRDYVDSITKEFGDSENPYRKLFTESKELVIRGLEKNPREVKRFINSYIATQEIFKNQNLIHEILLLLQIFQFRWPTFYDRIFSFKDENGFNEFCQDVLKSIEDQNFESPKHKEFINKHIGVKEFLTEEKTKGIFKDLAKLSLEDLKKYRRAGMALGPEEVSEGRPMRREQVEEAISKKKSLAGKDMQYADLHGLDFSNLDLSKATLSNADLTGAILINTNLTGANLSVAFLIGADLTRADLREANLNGATLKEANLSGLDLSQVRYLDGVKELSRADLTKTKLGEVDLSGKDLSEINLSGADLTNAKLANADLRKAKLIEINLSRKDLSGTNFSKADLSKADLTGANLTKANLSDAMLYGTKLNKAKLDGATIKGVEFDEKTDTKDIELWKMRYYYNLDEDVKDAITVLNKLDEGLKEKIIEDNKDNTDNEIWSKIIDEINKK